MTHNTLTVKQLIEQLQQFDENTLVAIESDEGDLFEVDGYVTTQDIYLRHRHNNQWVRDAEPTTIVVIRQNGRKCALYSFAVAPTTEARRFKEL